MLRPSLEHTAPWGDGATVTARSRAQVAEFVAGTYRWMAAGLTLTAAAAFLVAGTPSLVEAIFANQLLFFGLIAAELGLVIWLSVRIEKMSARAAVGAFLGYSVLNGVTLSVILLAYTMASVASTFVIAGGMFGGMAVYGSRTQRDLMGMRSFLMMGLFGVFIAMIVNMFLQSSAIDWVVSGIGVLVFTGLAAYDAQRIQRMALSVGPGEAAQKASIMGALALYLDFINLFLFLLRFLGTQRD